MSRPTAGGALFALPREIRDYVYRFALSDRYLVYGKACRGPWDYDNLCDSYTDRGPARLSILHLSKSIREEALPCLYNHCVFRFAISPTEYHHCDDLPWRGQSTPSSSIPKPLILEMANNLMKVELVFDMTYWDDCSGERPISEIGMDEMCKCTVFAFTGPQKKRDIFSITFYSISGGKMHTVIMTPFFQSIKAMKGFKTLRVQAQSYYEHKDSLVEFLDPSVLQEAMASAKSGSTGDPAPFCHCLIPDRIPREEMGKWLDQNLYEDTFEDGAEWLEDAQEELEPELGPSTVHDVPDAYNVVYARYMEFHPRENHIKNLEAELARLK